MTSNEGPGSVDASSLSIPVHWLLPHSWLLLFWSFLAKGVISIQRGIDKEQVSSRERRDALVKKFSSRFFLIGRTLYLISALVQKV